MKLSIRFLPLLAMAAIVSSALNTAEARPFGQDQERRCDNASLKGDYGFSARGTTLAGVPLPAPLIGDFSSSGVSRFDGKGHFTLVATASFNGVIQPVETKGNYQVGSDCTYVSKAENGTSFRAVIVEGGQGILILQTNPATVIAGSARKQRPMTHYHDQDDRDQFACNEKLVRGAYGFLAEGMAGPPTLPEASAGPLSGVGTVNFRANGEFLLIDNRSVNGTLDPQPLPLTGSYKVNKNCTLTMSFDVGFTFRAAITDGGDQIVFVETDPGTTLLVNAKRL